MRRAVAVYTLFIIIAIGMAIFFAVLILTSWLEIETGDVATASCVSKQQDYCLKWKTTNIRPTDWSTSPPKDCEKYGITEPSSLEECNIG